MTASRSDQLALRRKMLVLQARLQRMQLGRDVQVVASSLDPATAASRLAAQVRERPSLLLAGVVAFAAARHVGVRRILRQALLGWRTWRDIRATYRR